jgi:hypothetical protein
MEETYKNDYDKLGKLISEWYIKNDKEKKKINIKEDLSKFTYKYNKEYYKNKIFYSLSENVLEQLDLCIEFCEESEELNDIWDYLQFMTSSHTISKNNIRIIKILLKDKNTNKYLGIIELSSDFYSLANREEHIGWNNIVKKNNLKYILCISTCVGLQPIAHNLNIGKLLSVLVFSKEIEEYFYNKFGYYYVAVSTTSLYGKSIQYDRLKELKFIGYTKGYGTSQIPEYIYEQMIIFFKKYYINEYKKLSGSGKLRKIVFISRLFGYNNNLVFHGNKRGIYFGYINEQSKKYLMGEISEFNVNNLRTVDEIINWWKNRWAVNRWTKLFNNKLLKLSFELKNMSKKELFNEYIKQNNYYNYHHDENYNKKIKNRNKLYYLENRELKDKVDISKNKRTLDFNEIEEIIEWKLKKINLEKFTDNKIISHKKLAIYLSDKYNKVITEQMIKYYWNGTVKLYEEEFVELYKDNYKEIYNKYIEIINFKL